MFQKTPDQMKLNNARNQARERAQQEAQRQAERVKGEVGRQMFHLLEDYFPEQARAQRRKDRMRTLAIGVAIGFFLRHYVGR